MPSRFQRARDFKFVNRISTDMTLAVTTWSNLDTTLDLTLRALVGEVIEVGISGYINGGTPGGFTDVVTMVGGSPVRSFGEQGAINATGFGIVGWYAPPSASAGTQPVGGPRMMAVQAGDLVSGYVTLRLQGRCATASTVTWYASSANGTFQWWAKNRGLVDPN